MTHEEWSMFFFFFALLLFTASVEARTLDLSKPEDVIRAEIRLGCAPDPAKPRMSWMTGKLIARRLGEADKHIFDVQAMNTRACSTTEDKARGPGYRAVTREILIYLDPATGKILARWDNPWTGETVDVITMFNDPVNMPETKFARGADGKPATWEGQMVNGFAVTTRVNSIFRDSPFGGDYQAFTGGKYAVMEVSAMTIPAAEWLDTNHKGPLRAVSNWTRISPWLPWMKMGGREGQTVLASVWHTAASMDEVPEPLRSYVRDKQPMYATAPALDDMRPSVNSWMAMKKVIDEHRK
jgi:Protein of unknown function (DUF1838)